MHESPGLPFLGLSLALTIQGSPMLLAYNPGERVWLRLRRGEVIVSVLDRDRDEQDQIRYLLEAPDGSLFQSTDERLRPICEEPLVIDG